MKLIFLGPPGAGKGTQALGVSSRLNVPHISTGNMLRAAVRNETPMGLAAKKFMDAGKLVPDEVLIEMVRERLSMVDCKPGYLLDGFPRTVEQAEALEQIASPDRVINIAVPDECLLDRLTGRRVCGKCSGTFHISKPVSYTHLDVYKRQAPGHAVPGVRKEDISVAKTSMKIKQQRAPKFSTRAYTRCRICGRPHSVLRKYGVCRICFRELAYKGQIPGVRKASW